MADREDGPTSRATEPREPADSDPGSSSGGLESRVLLERARVRLLGRSPEPVRVGRYRILSRLGQGGMGVVYLAQDDELDRRVAIKILRHDLAPSSAGRSRLLREAQATARLSHPNVVHVYEVGHEADQVYMAMEYIEGETLRRWCDSEPRSCAELVAIFSAAGDALAAAHAAGLVHRDFKPDNVLVGRDGRPRVVDFGLARVDEAMITTSGREPTARHVPVDVTATATLAGTPAYMAPEQHSRQGADPRSDQFAFCVSLFEALYRKRPFAGDTLTEIAVHIAEGTMVPVDPLAHGVPVGVHEAVLRGLSRHPRQRFATMPELLAALSEAAAPRMRRAWWPFAAIGAAAMGIAALQLVPPREPMADDAATILGEERVLSPWEPIVAESQLPQPVPTPLPDDAAGVTVHRLANGLTVYVAHRPLEPTITAHVAVRASVDDVADEDQGMAALVLDVMLQGSDRLGTVSWAQEGPLVGIEHALLSALVTTDDPAERKRIEQLLDAAHQSARSLRIPYEPITIGNELGFRRQTVLGGQGATFSAEIPTHRMGAWLEITAEMLQRPSFRAFAATAAQRVELIRWVNQDGLAERASILALAPFIGRTYDPEAAATVVRSLPLARAQAFHRAYFRPNNTAIVLVGDITASEALPIVEEHFGEWEPAAIPQATFVPREPEPTRIPKEIESGDWQMLELAWPMPRPGTEEARVIGALADALYGRDGLVAAALGLRDPSDVFVYDMPLVLRVNVATRPDDSHAEIERKIVAMLHEVADDELDDATWSRALARASLDSQRWARSRRNLALEIEASYLYRQEWADTAKRLSSTIQRADVVAGAKALLSRPMVVLDQRPGEPWMIDVEPLAIAPMKIVLDTRSAWAREVLAQPSTPAEPRFLVAGSHYEPTEHGAGRVITTKAADPLFDLTWIVPVGARTDPWACDAVRAKVRVVPVAGVDVDATCSNDDSRITIVGPSARFAELWPELLPWLGAPAIPEADLQAHLADALRWRKDERAHALWSSEAAHLWALRGEHGLDAHLPDDATLRRRGVTAVAASMRELATFAPDILYSGPTPEVLRARLPPASERGGPPPLPFLFREQDEPTVVVLHEPGRPQAEVRVLAPQIRGGPESELAAQMYEFMGDDTVADDALVRLELQVWVPPDGGGPILHGIGYRVAPKQLDVAIETALAFLQRRPDRKGFAIAQARVEADFRSVRVPPHAIPEHVRRWGRGTTQDPRIAQWLALPGLSYETFERYVGELARTTPYISIVADVDTIDMAALRRHGRVIQVDLDDVLRDSRQTELGILGVPLINTGPD